MLFDGMMALAGAAVVDYARSARRQSKGLGLGLVPLRTRPRSWGEGGVRVLPPLPCKVSVGSLPRAYGAPGVYSGLSFAVLGEQGGGGGGHRPEFLQINFCTLWGYWGIHRAGAMGPGGGGYTCLKTDFVDCR